MGPKANNIVSVSIYCNIGVKCMQESGWFLMEVCPKSSKMQEFSRNEIRKMKKRPNYSMRIENPQSMFAGFHRLPAHWQIPNFSVR